MRDQLIRYVDLLFAGAPDADDIKQEILQNTLDRFDDLIAQGKTPAAAYSLAISGIGDIGEILGNQNTVTASAANAPAASKPVTPIWRKVLRAVAICLYIICPIPLFILSEIGMDIIGLCGLLSIVAIATALMIIAGSNSPTPSKKEEFSSTTQSPQAELRKAVRKIINTTGIVGYFILSFLTQAWHITWLVFPIMAAVQGLANACLDLKEAKSNEA